MLETGQIELILGKAAKYQKASGEMPEAFWYPIDFGTVAQSTPFSDAIGVSV